ncbi:hypothetical protein [Methylobacterium thuringiense]|uniref:Uncharacterized protein n=1 Tax=Methylobacterium thuringiense TaxID=1003091 RepID=A0ABQ4TRY3_9HYPH|nr:hypothetical protein [Methylobacterium thuringiense]GJE57396.1 hypothetical protein EKPJFOCH_3910 [Methylobacterium thuringiense]
MPRYFFIINNSNAIEWDDLGSECSGRLDIEQTAQRMLAAFVERYAGTPTPLCLAVLAVGGAVVMTAAGISPDEMQMFWR